MAAVATWMLKLKGDDGSVTITLHMYTPKSRLVKDDDGGATITFGICGTWTCQRRPRCSPQVFPLISPKY